MTLYRREVAFIVGFALLGFAPLFLEAYWVGLLTQALIFGGFALGLDLLVGYAGMPTLGHAVFFGLGGYSTALLILQLGLDPWLSAIGGVLITLVVALLFAPLAVRTRGLTFLTITLAFGQVGWGLATRWTNFTGGENGIPGIPRPDFFWNIESDSGFYILILLFVAILSVLLSLFAKSPVGLSLNGVRNSDARMMALGYDVNRQRVIAFVIAAFVASVYGVLSAFYNKFIGPGSLSWQLSAQMLLSVVIGGGRSLWGPLIAGSGLHILKNILIANTQRWPMVLGGLYVITVVFLPNGIASLPPKIRQWWERAPAKLKNQETNLA